MAHCDRLYCGVLSTATAVAATSSCCGSLHTSVISWLPSGCGILRGALHDPSGVPVILIGNKCDKKDKVRSASQRTRSDPQWDPHLFGPCDPPVKRRLKPFRLRPFTAVSAVHCSCPAARAVARQSLSPQQLCVFGKHCPFKDRSIVATVTHSP